MSVPSRGDKVPERSNSRSNGSRGPGDNKDKEQTNADKQEETGELLPLWEPRISASNGRTYYYNTETFQSTWKRPSVPASTESTKPQPPPSASRDNDTRQESQSVASADRHAPRQEESSRRLDRRDTAPTTAALSTAGSAADPSSSWSRSSRRRSPSPPPAQADRERERVERSRDQEPVKPSRRPNGQRSAVDDSERALHHTPSPFTTPRERNVDLPSHQQPQSRRPDPNVDNLERYFPAVTESTDRYIGTAGKEILRGQRGDRSDRDRDRERERTRTSDEKPSNRRGRSPETFEAQPQESSHQTSHSRRGRSDEDSHNYEANNIPSSTPSTLSSPTHSPLFDSCMCCTNPHGQSQYLPPSLVASRAWCREGWNANHVTSFPRFFSTRLSSVKEAHWIFSFPPFFPLLLPPFPFARLFLFPISQDIGLL
ncbi:hypothetical protein SISSUDRAFT_260681 [Sistotremastrum suecicum HHB10207 ss-3]|uniref:WW domain-containing protein n=1 Tax=Sistotremastrum suecicum HHB10207 ss-3 TaxID=1314776 RepID=A0A166GDT1_9AGAM|nr:hypothetical protein SISSUDRAFT_260681 [Sistotremastrum suecicum HHB10207 ss-3]